MAITPGGRVGDASPLGKPGGPRRLTDYTREVAHALIRKGMPEGMAIAIARSQIAKWGTGRGKKVRPQVRAAAAKSDVEQHVLDHNKRGSKHSNPGKNDIELSETNGWKKWDADHRGHAANVTSIAEAQKRLRHHSAAASRKANDRRFGESQVEGHKSAARIYRARRDQLVNQKIQRGEQGKLFGIGASLSSRDIALSIVSTANSPGATMGTEHVKPRGETLDFGRDGSKWRHGWIPLNTAAARIKAKKAAGGGHDGGGLKVAKGRVKVHALPSGEGRNKFAPPKRTAREHLHAGAVARHSIKAHADAAEKRGNLMDVPAEHKSAVVKELASRRSNSDLKAMTRSGGTPEGNAAQAELLKRTHPIGAKVNFEHPTLGDRKGTITAHRGSRVEVTHDVKIGNGSIRQTLVTEPGKVTLTGNQSYNFKTGEVTEGKSLAKTHPIGAPVIAKQPGIEAETRGHITGHSDGMLKVQYKDRHGNQTIGTFNPSHTRVMTGLEAAAHDYKHGSPTARPGRKPQETPEEVAKRIGMTFPKPTVKSHAIVGEGTVESPSKPVSRRSANSKTEKPRMTTTAAGVSKIQANKLQPGDVVEPGGHADKYNSDVHKTVAKVEPTGRSVIVHYTDGSKSNPMANYRMKVHPPKS